jgi:hypothetical protein
LRACFVEASFVAFCQWSFNSERLRLWGGSRHLVS